MALPSTPLPTDGYAPASVSYTLATSNGLTVQISLGVPSPDRRTAAEEFLPYLEEALNTLRTNYENDVPQTISYIARSYEASVQDTI